MVTAVVDRGRGGCLQSGVVGGDLRTTRGGGGHSGTEWVLTAKRLHRAEALNVKI